MSESPTRAEFDAARRLALAARLRRLIERRYPRCGGRRRNVIDAGIIALRKELAGLPVAPAAPPRVREQPKAVIRRDGRMAATGERD